MKCTKAKYPLLFSDRMEVTGLEEGQWYAYRVKALNRLGASPQTPQEVHPGLPRLPLANTQPCKWQATQVLTVRLWGGWRVQPLS